MPITGKTKASIVKSQWFSYACSACKVWLCLMGASILWTIKKTEQKQNKTPVSPLKENDILLPFAILFLWLNLEDH